MTTKPCKANETASAPPVFSRRRIGGLLVLLAALVSIALFSSKGPSERLLTRGHGDGQIQNFPGRAFSGHVYRSGSLPLWDPNIYSGMPHAASVLPAVFYPPNIVLYALFPPVVAFNLSVVLHFCLAAYFQALYLRSVELPRHSVWLGVMVFAVGMVALRSVTQLFNAVVWIPCMFYCVERWKHTLSWKYPLGAGICVAMQLLAGWAQLVVLSFIYIAVEAAISLWNTPKRRRFLAGLLVSGLCVALLAMLQILLTLELKHQSNLEATSWQHFVSASYPPPLLLTLIFPYFLGSDWTVLYHMPFWGPAPGIGILSTYVGIFPLMLSILALRRWRSPAVRFGAVTVVVSLLLGFGGYTPISTLLYRVPPYNFFRDHFINLVFFVFAIALLAAHGVAELTSREQLSRMWRVGLAVVFVAIMVAVPLVAGKLLRMLNPAISPMPADWQSRLAETVRLSNPAIAIPCTLILLSALLFWLWSRRPASITFRNLAFTLVALDLFSFAGVREQIATSAVPSQSERAMQEAMSASSHGDPFRAMSLTRDYPFLRVNLNELLPYQEVLGYGSFLPRGYADLLPLNTGGASGRWRELLVNNRILSLLNTRFVIADSQQLQILRRNVAVEDEFERGRDRAPNEARSSPESGGEVELHWETFGPTVFSGDNVILKAPGPLAFTGIQQQLHFKKNSVYELAFEVRGDPTPTKSMDFDFVWNGGFEHGGVSPWMISPAFTRVTHIFLNEDVENVAVKLNTLSTSKLFVRNISLRRLGPLPFGPPSYRVLSRAGSLVLLKNENALPRAYFVSSIRPVSSFLEAYSVLWDMEAPLDLRNEALVEGPAAAPGGKLDPGKVESLEYSPNTVRMRTSCSGKCFLVLADSYYPGWRATVDGSRTRIYRTNAVVRGIFVGPGEHTVEFRYRPKSLISGLLISSVAWVLVIALLVVLHRRQTRVNANRGQF